MEYSSIYISNNDITNIDRPKVYHKKMMGDHPRKKGEQIMEFKVLSVLKKFIPEEQFEALKDELGKFEGELNTDITKYITSNTPDKDSLLKDAKALAHLEVIKELGIKGVETVEQLNSHIETVKLSSTEQAQELTRLETELGRVTGEYETEEIGRAHV